MNKEEYFYMEIINFVLQTISSTEYLKDNKIYSKKYNKIDFNNNVIQKLISEPQSTDIKPGLYPFLIGLGSSVHFFAIKKVNDKFIMANGYADNFNLKNSIGLDAQTNHSHGLCQTFALMYYLGYEKLLFKSNETVNAYFKNVQIGLNFLLSYITSDYNRDRIWNINSLNRNIEPLYKDLNKKYRVENYRKIKNKFETEEEKTYVKKNEISLKTLLAYLTSKDNVPKLKLWFNE